MSENEFGVIYLYRCLDCGKYLGEIIKGNTEESIYEKIEHFRKQDKECYFCGNKKNFIEIDIRLQTEAIREIIQNQRLESLTY